MDARPRNLFTAFPGGEAGRIDGGWFSARGWRIARVAAPFARPHRRWLAWGLLASVLVVGLRLALPWTFRLVLEPWLNGRPSLAGGGSAWLFPGIHPAVAMGVVFLLLLLGIGYADYRARVDFARFAIGMVRDLRAAVFRAAARDDAPDPAVPAGDLVARLVGDTARIKAGLKGFLVHVATNGLLFGGIVLVLSWMDLPLGLTFAAAGMLAGLVTLFGASRIFRVALKYRRKEGKLADAIRLAAEEGLPEDGFSRINGSSGVHEAAVTRLQGMTTWAVHGILGVAVVAALWVGFQGLTAGRLAAGDMFVLLAYVLMLRAPLVQLARQGARTGKILAPADRLVQLLAAEPGAPGEASSPAALYDRLQLAGVKVSTPGSQERRRRLGPIDLDLPARRHIAILGNRGAGKSTLLEVIAGTLRTKHGQVLWDGINPEEEPRVAYLPQVPKWRRRTLREFLDLPPGPISPRQQEILSAGGAMQVLKRLPLELESRIGSADLSDGEARLLDLTRILLGDAPLWLLDNPTASLSRRKAEELIAAVLGVAERATVIMALNHPHAIERFDRIVVLKRGRVVFDGDPAEWALRQPRNPKGSES